MSETPAINTTDSSVVSISTKTTEKRRKNTDVIVNADKRNFIMEENTQTQKQEEEKKDKRRERKTKERRKKTKEE